MDFSIIKKWVQVQALLLTSRLTSGRLLNLSGFRSTLLNGVLFKSLNYRFVLKIKLAKTCQVSLEHSKCSINVCCSYHYSNWMTSFAWHWIRLTLSHCTLVKEQNGDIHNPPPQEAKHVTTLRLVGEGSAWDSCGVLSDSITETPWHRQIQSDNDGNQ